MNYISIDGKIRKIEELQEEDGAKFIKLRVDHATSDIKDKFFYDCYIHNYNKHKFIQNKLFNIDDIVIIRGQLCKGKENGLACEVKIIKHKNKQKGEKNEDQKQD